MASLSNGIGVDMNDVSNLALYGQLVVFKNDPNRVEITWHSPDSSLQRILQSLAHHLDLEYEYSLATRNVRITRVVSEEALDDFEFMDFNYVESASQAIQGSTQVGGFQNQDTVNPLALSLSSQKPAAEWGMSMLSPTTTLQGSSIHETESSSMISVDGQNERTFGTWMDDPVSPSFVPITSPSYSSPPGLDMSMFESGHQNMDGSHPVESSGAVPSTWGSGDHALSNMDFSSRNFKFEQIQELPLRAKEEADSNKRKRHSPTVEVHDARNLRHSDLNDPKTKEIYHELTMFKNDPKRDILDLPVNLPANERRTIRTLAHHIGLDHRNAGVGDRRRIQLFKRKSQLGKFGSGSLWSLGHRAPFSSQYGNQSESLNSVAPRRLSTTSSLASFKPVMLSATRSLSVMSSRDKPKSTSGRTSSITSKGSSGFQEIIFDSRSNYSESQLSGTSGRRGPLSAVGRNAMNAVRRIGACWKCKFSRQTCDTETPCELCSVKTNGKNNHWQRIGCKRGSIKERMVPVVLCPIDAGHTYSSLRDEGLQCIDSQPRHAVYANRLLQDNLERREGELVVLGSLISNCNYVKEPTPLVLSKFEQLAVIECFPGSRYCSLEPESLPELIPLNECILAIAWELSDRQHTLTFCGKSHENLIRLSRLAALYQSQVASDQLIAQSLICLRSCLEAIPIYQSGYLDRPVHKVCEPTLCQTKCIANLNMHLNLYLDELSRVLFKKENMRNRKLWWLSVFYSLCISSYVRQALIALGNFPLVNVRSNHALAQKLQQSGYTQYLHLAVRLFSAVSGSYDPIISDQARTGSRSGSAASIIPSSKDIRNARSAVLWDEWGRMGIASSFDYLKDIFEDTQTDSP